MIVRTVNGELRGRYAKTFEKDMEEAFEWIKKEKLEITGKQYCMSGNMISCILELVPAFTVKVPKEVEVAKPRRAAESKAKASKATGRKAKA